MTHIKPAPELTDETILQKIYWIRNQRVMLDSDLAELYKVPTKVFNQAVKRNLQRFPADFMFLLTQDEFDNLRSQIVTSSWGGRRYLPTAFTEQGVAMISSILNSETAIAVNIRIIRLFTKMRQVLLQHKDLLLQVQQLEQRLEKQEEDIQLIFRYLKQLLDPPPVKRNPIGFKQKNE